MHACASGPSLPRSPTGLEAQEPGRRSCTDFPQGRPSITSRVSGLRLDLTGSLSLDGLDVLLGLGDLLALGCKDDLQEIQGSDVGL